MELIISQVPHLTASRIRKEDILAMPNFFASDAEGHLSEPGDLFLYPLLRMR